MNVFSPYSRSAYADAFYHQPNLKTDCGYSPILSSPTFNTLQNSGDVDNYFFGVACCEIERAPTSPLRMLDQICDELTLTQANSKDCPTGKEFESPNTQISREISFHSSSDLFSVRQRALDVSFKATTFCTDFKQEARTRQVSNTTEGTIMSTQSDDHRGTSNSPIEPGVPLRRNLSNKDHDSNPARSRGISGLSNDLNII